MALAVPFPSQDKIMQKTSVGYYRDLWAPSAFDYDVFEDKFWGDALLSLYPSAKTNGTSAAVTFTEHNSNGFLELVTGTANDGYAGQGVGLQLTGDRGILYECVFRTPSAITTLKFEMGLSDADDDAGAVNVKATPSGTATDFAVFCFDTDDDTNVTFIANKGGTLTSQDLSNVTLAASTTYRIAIRVQGDGVSAWWNGAKVAGNHLVEGGNKLTPWAFAQARTGSASRTVQLHKWRAIQPAY